MESSVWLNAAEKKWDILPSSLRNLIFRLDNGTRETIEELRLREGKPLSMVSAGKERTPHEWEKRVVTSNDLSWILEAVGQGSIHTIMEQMKQGFLSVEGGHRIGICGSAVMKNGELINFRNISSLSVRFSHEISGIGESLLPKLIKQGRLQSTLLFSPPGGGKTTLLRDLIRCVSDGIGTQSLRVGIADERGELCGMYQGIPQHNVGRCTDIMEGCPKAKALLMLLRGMNPQVLAMDEITDPRDLRAMEEIAGCGVILLATAHGSSPEEIRMRPIYRELLQKQIFRRFVWITIQQGKRCYRTLTAEEMGEL